MKHIAETVQLNPYTSPLLDFYCSGMTRGTLDIETTGLSPSQCSFVLGGLYDFDGCTVHQFFAETLAEEPAALAAFYDAASSLDMIVTYNGKHFDLPFMETRYRHWFGQAYEGDLPFHLDLYLLLNGHSPIKQFVPNLKQKTVENYMGLWTDRRDEIDGAESVALYFDYLKSGDEQLLAKILLHNRDDVVQLSRLLKVIAKCDVHKGMNKCGFPAAGCSVNKTRLHRNHLMFSGIQLKAPCDYRFYQLGDFPAHGEFHKVSRTFDVTVPVIRASGLTVIDLYAAGVDPQKFKAYPSYSSGFLAVESPEGIGYMELNHFILELMAKIRHEINNEPFCES